MKICWLPAVDIGNSTISSTSSNVINSSILLLNAGQVDRKQDRRNRHEDSGGAKSEQVTLVQQEPRISTDV